MSPELILGRKKPTPHTLRLTDPGGSQTASNSLRSKSKANSGDEKYEYSAIALEKRLSSQSVIAMKRGSCFCARGQVARLQFRKQHVGTTRSAAKNSSKLYERISRSLARSC